MQRQKRKKSQREMGWHGFAAGALILEHVKKERAAAHTDTTSSLDVRKDSFYITENIRPSMDARHSSASSFEMNWNRCMSFAANR